MSPSKKQHLLDFLQHTSAINSSHLFTLLATIEAPESLQELGTISKNLTHILPFLLHTIPGHFQHEVIDDWIAICCVIDEKKEKINDIIPDFYLPGRTRPKTGFINDHPLYYSLWPAPATSDTADFFYHLQAHFISSINSLIRNELKVEKENYIDIRRKISNIIRNHLKETLYYQLYNLLPSPPLTISKLTNVILSVSSPLHSSKMANTLNDFSRLLDFASKKRSEKSRSTRTHIKTNTNHIMNHQEEDPDAEIPKPSSTTIRFFTDPSNQEPVDNGEAPDELLRKSICWNSSKPLESKKGESFNLYKHKTKNSHRYIATANQMLPHKWERLNLYEIMNFIYICQTLSRGHFKLVNITKYMQKQLAALFTVIYWLSKPLHIARTIKLTMIPPLPEEITSFSVLVSTDGGTWIIPFPELRSSRKMSQNDVPCMRLPAKMISLPMSSLQNSLLYPWFSHITKNRRTLSPPFFPSKGPKLEILLKEVLSKCNAKLGTRFTLNRITNHFKQYLGDEFNDFTESAVCLGDSPPTGQQSSMYYSVPMENYLQKKYTDACLKIKAFLHSNVKSIELHREIKYRYDSCASIGSQTCLTGKVIKLLSKDLANKVEYLRRKNRYDSRAILHFHNSFTAYCVLFLKFVSGYRDVTEPIHAISDFYPELSALVISDKDDRDNSKSRIVFLPLLFTQQLNEYKRHRQQLITHLTLINPTLADQLKAEKRNLPQFKPLTGKSLPFFFFLDIKNGALNNITPSNLKNQIQWSYNLPSNANRHFLRTRLRELKVPGEIVDAYMGHWEHGQEPFGKFSTFSAHSFKKLIHPALEQICIEAEWKTIKGIRK